MIRRRCPNCRTRLIDKSGALPVFECPSCKAVATASTGGHFVIELPLRREWVNVRGWDLPLNERHEFESRYRCVVCGLETEGHAAGLQLQSFTCKDVVRGETPGGGR